MGQRFTEGRAHAFNLIFLQGIEERKAEQPSGNGNSFGKVPAPERNSVHDRLQMGRREISSALNSCLLQVYPYLVTVSLMKILCEQHWIGEPANPVIL